MIEDERHAVKLLVISDIQENWPALQAHAAVAALGVLGAYVGAVQAVLRTGQANG